MLIDLWHYGLAVGQKWYAMVTGVLFVLDQSLNWFSHRAKEWLDKRWPVERRRPLEIAALVVLFAFAGFEVYRNEHSGRVSAESDKTKSEAALARAQGENSALREQLRRLPIAPTAAPTPISPPMAAAPATAKSKEPPLKRLVRYDFPQIMSERAKDDSADLFKGLKLEVFNPSPEETLSVSVIWRDINIDGIEVLKDDHKSKSIIIQQGQGFIFSLIRQSSGVVLSNGTHVLSFSFDVVYDTVPATGVRISHRAFRAPISFHADNRVEMPLELVDEAEK